jgi:hypothetical protein
MCKFKEKIDQIQKLLADLEIDLKPFLDLNLQQEKNAQLVSIEKSIAQLQKLGVPIPEELRQLKLRLLRELDNAKEAKETQTLLSAILKPFVQLPKEGKIRKERISSIESSYKSKSKIELADLIRAKLILPNTNIEKTYKGILYKAIITDNGQIQLSHNNKTEFYDSPSPAAVAIAGKRKNGWTWWKVSDGQKKEMLDYYRQKYKEYEAETRG